MRPFLILIFTIFTSLSQALPKLNISKKATKLRTEFVGSSIKDANDQVCAAIFIETNLEDLNFDSYNGVVKVDAEKSGFYKVYLSPTERVLEIYSNGYSTYKLILSNHSIRLKSKEIWKISITGKKESVEYPVLLNSDPPADKLYINDVLYANTKLIKLPKGVHKVTIETEFYERYSTSIRVDENNFRFDFDLVKQTANDVLIETTPSSAQIFLNDKLMGISPVRIQGLMSNSYQINVQKDNYNISSHTVKINKDNSDLNLQLTKNAGEININLNAAAIIQINNKIDTVKNLRFSKTLLAGDYNLNITPLSNRYKRENRNISIEAGKQNSLEISFKPIITTITLKNPDFTLNDADVFLTTESIESFNPMEEAFIGKLDAERKLELEVGTYKLTIKKDRYYNFTQQLTVSKEENLSFTVNLTPVEESFYITQNDMRFARNWKLYTAAGFFALSYIMQSQADSKLDEYNSAKTTAAALSLKEDVNSFDNYRDYNIYAGSAFLIWALINQFQIPELNHSKYQLGASKDGKINLSVNF